MVAGRESTEHFRALRAEAVGIALVIAGAWLAFATDRFAGVAMCAVGAALLGWSGASYAKSRSEVKAAAERPRVQHSPPQV